MMKIMTTATQSIHYDILFNLEDHIWSVWVIELFELKASSMDTDLFHLKCKTSLCGWLFLARNFIPTHIFVPTIFDRSLTFIHI